MVYKAIATIAKGMSSSYIIQYGRTVLELGWNILYIGRECGLE